MPAHPGGILVNIILAAQLALPRLEIGLQGASGPTETALTLQVLALLTVLALAPSILIMLTSFTRIVVVLSFVRSALATNQVPPNQVIVGLALFLTFFTMAPTWNQVYQQAISPYLDGKISEQEALQAAEKPLRTFMLRSTRKADLALFLNHLQPASPATAVATEASDASQTPDSAGAPEAAATQDVARTPDTGTTETLATDVPFSALVPAFVISELKTAFQLGFVIYIPFLVIDMVVASSLMSMGMIMLPPVMISLPFKILLFVLADGWHLITSSLLDSYR